MKENKAQTRKDEENRIKKEIKISSKRRENFPFDPPSPPDSSGFFLSSLILLNWKLFPFSVLITRHLIWCSSVFFHQRKSFSFSSLPFRPPFNWISSNKEQKQ